MGDRVCGILYNCIVLGLLSRLLFCMAGGNKAAPVRHFRAGSRVDCIADCSRAWARRFRYARKNGLRVRKMLLF